VIRKGDKIIFKPEYREPGDTAQYYAHSDEWDDGRIQVTSLPTETLPLPPINTVLVSMLEKAAG
jgi:hypothetical protein